MRTWCPLFHEIPPSGSGERPAAPDRGLVSRICYGIPRWFGGIVGDDTWVVLQQQISLSPLIRHYRATFPPKGKAVAKFVSLLIGMLVSDLHLQAPVALCSHIPASPSTHKNRAIAALSEIYTPPNHKKLPSAGLHTFVLCPHFVPHRSVKTATQ